MNSCVRAVWKNISRKKCDICWMADNNPLRYGEFIDLRHTNLKLRFHDLCLFSATCIEQTGSFDEGLNGFRVRDIIDSFAEFREICCFYCRYPSAAIECAEPMCGRRFHYICGYNKFCLTQFAGQYLSYCHQHIPAEFCETVNTKDRDCDICLNELPLATETHFNPLLIIRTRCDSECPQGLLHRECVQKYAYTAANNFKCPVCWSLEFRTYAAERGIYTPARQAAWEQEPGAYKDIDKHKETKERNPTV